MKLEDGIESQAEAVCWRLSRGRAKGFIRI